MTVNQFEYSSVSVSLVRTHSYFENLCALCSPCPLKTLVIAEMAVLEIGGIDNVKSGGILYIYRHVSSDCPVDL